MSDRVDGERDKAAAQSGARPDGPWTGEVAQLVLQDLFQDDLAPDNAIDLHLLVAQLTPSQAASVRRRGWFALPWPEQHLTLRVHTRRYPTVDAYQMPPKYESGTFLPALRCDLDDDLASGRDWPAVAAAEEAQTRRRDVYLCSFDVRTARRAPQGRLGFRSMARTGAGWARLVMEARRRGALKELLAASEAVQIKRLIGTVLEA